MSELFKRSEFNGDISKWDTSNVINMSYMFFLSKFNGDISNWNISNVEKMDDMFKWSKFKGDLTIWKPIKLDSCINMFEECKAQIPYWTDLTSAEARSAAIESYWLKKELDNSLSNHNMVSKKTKI